jgi:hypothetical protein
MPEKQMNCLFSTPNSNIKKAGGYTAPAYKILDGINAKPGNVSSAHHRQTRCSFPARWHEYDCLRD